MSFNLRQSGDLRRRPFEVSVTDFKDRAAEGASFWRGLVVGLLAGLTLGYVGLSGMLFRFWH